MTKKQCEICGYNEATTQAQVTYKEVDSCEQCKEWQSTVDKESTEHSLAEEHYNKHDQEYHGWLSFDTVFGK